MAKAKEVKCRFTHCSHPDDKLPPEQMVKDGGAYYHKECFELKNDMAKIRILYKSIDPCVIMSFLNKIINEAIFEKKIPPKDLIFALEYYQKTHRELKSPAQLFYIPYNKAVREALRGSKGNIKSRFDGKCDSLGKEPTDFKIKPIEEKKGFMKIIKRG